MSKESHNANSFSEWIEAAIGSYRSPVVIDRGHVLTSSQFLSCVDVLAAKLQPLSGKVVLLEESSSAAFLTLLIALTRIEAIIAPVSLSIADPERERVIKTVGASAIVRRGVSERDCVIELLDTRIAKLPSGIENGPAFIRFTSGTTGIAQGVCISAPVAKARALSVAAGFQLSPHDRALWLLPMEHHFVAALFGFLAAGVTIQIPKSRSLEDLQECSDCTVLYAAPPDFRMLSAIIHPGTFKQLKLAVATTAPISDVDSERFTAVTSVPVSRVFGAIEIGVALGNIHRRSSLPDSLGFPLPGYEVRICSGENEGRLAFRGPGICDGYATPHSERSDILQDGWFVTADIAEQLPDSSFRIIGRASSVINVGGFKVFPEEIENTLHEHPDVAEVRVRGSSHDILGSVVLAEVVRRPGSELTEKDLRKFCRTKLNRSKIPQRIDFVSELPKTLTGKIKRWI